jgi:hypothetical protein
LFSSIVVTFHENWQIKYEGGVAPVRAYHSCTLFRGELIFFGGNFPNPDPIPDGCSNDVDIFNIGELWAWFFTYIFRSSCC